MGSAVTAGFAAVTGPLDETGLLLLRADQGPPWLVETARDLTALGSNGVLGMLVIVLAAEAAIARRTQDVVLLLGTFAGGLLLVGIVKSLVARPRPDFGDPAVRVFTTSFPSSHATLSAAIATLIVLLLRRSGDRPAVAWFRVGAALLICAAIGLSRIAVGVHWPTDVLAGWVLGLAWALTCWRVARR